MHRRAPQEDRKELAREALGLPRVPVDARTLSDLQMIASGVFSPLEGFMLQQDYESVVEDMRIANGLAWSMPVTLSVREEVARSLRDESLVALVDGSGEPVATMYLRERYSYDKEREAREVYRTTDPEHPGVDYLYRQGDVLLGGEIDLLQPLDRGPFPNYYYELHELTRLFAEKGWRRWLASRPVTPSIGLTSTSRRAPWKPWTGSY